MSWIILALSLGASITSIIHGVFMLFGSLHVSGGAMFGIPSTMLSSLPVISGIIAMIGGIIAFNQSKWGALFLFISLGLCVPTRDTWLYGGLYFFAGLFCFFLKSKKTEQELLYGDYGDYDEEGSYPDDADFYYDQASVPPDNSDDIPVRPVNIPQSPVDADITVNDALQINNEPPRLRRRMSKSCPECGAIVSRENRFCPTCGAKLSVMPEEAELNLTSDDDIDIQSVNEQLLMPAGSIEEDELQAGIQGADIPVQAININSSDGDDMSTTQTVPNYRVLVKPKRNEQEYGDTMRSAPRSRAKNNIPVDDEAASSYQEFSKYTRRAKKRGRSAGRKVLSMLLLVAAVGGALYFLLGLRKLPPGELPPIPGTEPVKTNDTISVSNALPPVKNTDVVAEPVDLVVAENVLPNFTPERTPKSGIITGSSVNVRADHTTSSSRVTRLKVNSKVDIIGTFNVTSGQYAGIWYNIRTGGNEGWVYGKYVQPVGSGLPSGYSNALLKTFGSSKSQLVEALGNPTRSTSSSAEWPGLTATLKGEDITKIRLTSPNRELQNGLKTGMSQTALLQIMGYPSNQNGRTMNYNESGKTGLAIQLDKNNSISSITVNEI